MLPMLCWAALNKTGGHIIHSKTLFFLTFDLIFESAQQNNLEVKEVQESLDIELHLISFNTHILISKLITQVAIFLLSENLSRRELKPGTIWLKLPILPSVVLDKVGGYTIRPETLLFMSFGLAFESAVQNKSQVKELQKSLGT